MSTIVGLDPSLTSCGIAVLKGDFQAKRFTEIVMLQSVGHPGKHGSSYLNRSNRIVSQARLVLGLIPAEAELVVIEDMPVGMKAQPSLGDRWGLWWGLYSAIAARGVPIAVCNPGTRAKWATGNGRADKKLVLACVREQWPDARIHNDDCADALTMAAMGALKLGWTLPFETKDRHHAGLDVVAWPKELCA